MSILEKDLLIPVMSWLTKNGWHSTPEFIVPWGRCDIVGINKDILKGGNPQRIRQLRGLSIPLRARLLSWIEPYGTKGVLSRSLSSRLSKYVNASEFTNAIDFLIERQLISRGYGGRLQIIPHEFLTSHPLLSVELKLSRIEDVLRQAVNNQAFAKINYVALPFARAERLAKSLTYGNSVYDCIGILGVTNKKCIELRKPSVAPTQDRALEIQALSKLTNSTLRDSSTSTVRRFSQVYAQSSHL